MVERTLQAGPDVYPQEVVNRIAGLLPFPLDRGERSFIYSLAVAVYTTRRLIVVRQFQEWPDRHRQGSLPRLATDSKDGF